ncbi:unnamed protein product, partial [Musa acuminata var. zebrina]
PRGAPNLPKPPQPPRRRRKRRHRGFEGQRVREREVEAIMNFRNVRVPNVPGSGAAGTLVKVALIGGTAVYVALNSLYNVEGGHRAIVFNRIQGIKDKVYPEGTHLMIPWFERPIIYNVRARPHLVESTSGSRDLQMV